jgi:predicted phage terminase large subunit-like protein
MVTAETGTASPDVAAIFRPRMTPYIRPGKHGLTLKQHVYLLLSGVLDVLFGGAVGGGKTWSLLAAALQYVDVPGYSALLLRRTRPEMIQPGGILHQAHYMLSGTDAAWNGMDNCYRFPAGASVSFGSLEDAMAHLKYKGGEYQFIGFDEAGDIPAEQLQFLTTRLRRPADMRVPERVRYTSNPGGISHDYLKDLFLDHPIPGRRVYLPSRLADNPYLEQEEYLRRLGELDPITRERLINGDWSVRKSGMLFKREWFKFVDAAPAMIVRKVRSWDLAASESDTAKYTAGILMGVNRSDEVYVLDATQFKLTPGRRDDRIVAIANEDGKNIPIICEQEGGSGGTAQVDNLAARLMGWAIRGDSPSGKGDKFTRAGAFSSYAERGRVYLVRGEWNRAYLDHLEAVDPSRDAKRQYLDLMDASSAAFNWLAANRQAATVTVGPSLGAPSDDEDD